MQKKIAVIGFGEAGRAFAPGWLAAGAGAIKAYDRKTDAPIERAAMLDAYKRLRIDGKMTCGDAVSGAASVFSVVTADQALAAAEQAAPFIDAGTFWFDCNSCAPDTKRRASKVITAAGGRYVDVAVMAPVFPKKHHVPLLISGPDAKAGRAALEALDMKPGISGSQIGDASTIKMLRSVMVKGIEALTAECLLSARKAGVEAEVIASLTGSNPNINWRETGSYNLERMMAHGVRRAAEMRGSRPDRPHAWPAGPDERGHRRLAGRCGHPWP